jgi:hypothetical protein
MRAHIWEEYQLLYCTRARIALFRVGSNARATQRRRITPACEPH